MNKSYLPSVIIGLIIIVFGLLVLVNFFARFADTELLLMWWPAAFLLAGFILVSSPESKAVLVGVAMSLSATVAIIDHLGLINGGFRIIIILIALLLLSLAILTPSSVIKKPSV